MDINVLFNSEFSDHIDIVPITREATREAFAQLIDHAVTTIKSGGKILFFGNGGSASDCQHLATELTIRFIKDRPAIAAIALTTDTSALTACGNDLGFEEIFARQVEALAKPGDLVIGISTSGNSENVIRGLIKAREMGAIAAAFGGRDGGKMNGLADPYLIVPSQTTARIQEMHILLGHLLCAALEQKLELV